MLVSLRLLCLCPYAGYSGGQRGGTKTCRYQVAAVENGERSVAAVVHGFLIGDAKEAIPRTTIHRCAMPRYAMYLGRVRVKMNHRGHAFTENSRLGDVCAATRRARIRNGRPRSRPLDDCGRHGCKNPHTIRQPLQGMDTAVHEAETRTRNQLL